MTKKTSNLLIVAAAAFALASGMVAYKAKVDVRQQAEPPGDDKTSVIPEDAQHVTISQEGVKVVRDENETVTPDIPVPDLSRAPRYADWVTAESKNRVGTRVSALWASLKEDNLDFNNWLELGLQFSAVGDYEGARQAYEYAAALRPKNSWPTGISVSSTAIT